MKDFDEWIPVKDYTAVLERVATLAQMLDDSQEANRILHRWLSHKESQLSKVREILNERPKNEEA